MFRFIDKWFNLVDRFTTEDWRDRITAIKFFAGLVTALAIVCLIALLAFTGGPVSFIYIAPFAVLAIFGFIAGRLAGWIKGELVTRADEAADFRLAARIGASDSIQTRPLDGQ